MQSFRVSLKVGTREFFGEAISAQAAKHNAAMNALKIIKVSQGNLIQREGSASMKKLEKPVWRPKGRQLNMLSFVCVNTHSNTFMYIK